MINQAREAFCQGRFPASLIYVLIVSPFVLQAFLGGCDDSVAIWLPILWLRLTSCQRRDSVRDWIRGT